MQQPVCSACGSAACLLQGGDVCRHTRKLRTAKGERRIVDAAFPLPPRDKMMRKEKAEVKSG